MSGGFTRAADFLGRATFGRDNGFARDRRLMALAIALGLIAVLAKSGIAGLGLLALIGGVFVSDVKRYNREHPRG